MLFMVLIRGFLWYFVGKTNPVYGLLEDHQVMLLLSLMIAGMLKMQFGHWMVSTMQFFKNALQYDFDPPLRVEVV